MTTGVSSSDRIEDTVIGGEEILELRCQGIERIICVILKSLRIRIKLVSEGVILRQEPNP